ncbi:MAG TPA: serine/threonine-protein kinase [Ktedonobacteraceae bacterium]|jgi:serine/threonine protein kinase|nr:serine/threonine-protein kinase [Ktedonobacteraceae bacterium]
MADRVGQQLGNYRLVRLLGQGGFAEVYLGEHVYLDTTAAIKVLHTRLDDDDIEHFRDEARTVARLVHPNIVRVLEFNVQDGIPYLVVDYAPNGTLRKRHPRGIPVPLITIVAYVKQVASALHYAHEQKVIHRDVKPENMLIGRRNEILLSDFGIALVAQSSRYSSSNGKMQDMAGTIAYMAPEQIHAQACPNSDQYSLGIVVYEWLSGSRPFQGSFTEIAVKQTMAAPPPLREKDSSISEETEQVVMKALAKAPQDRFEDVQAFAIALEHAALQAPGVIIAPGNTPLPPPPGSSVDTIQLSRQEDLSSDLLTMPSQTPPSIGSLLQAMSPSLETPAVDEAQVAAQPPASRKEKPISRRKVLLGLVGAAVAAAAGGGLALFEYEQHTQHPVTTTAGSLLFTFRGHTELVWSAAFSPDGQRVASGSGDDTAQVWDATTGDHLNIYMRHTDSVYSVAWSPNGQRIASASYDKTVQIWDATFGDPFYTYRGHLSWVWTARWSPDGKLIASAGGDSTVQVWSSAGDGHRFTYRGHKAPVYTVAWSPDGKLIASAGNDGTVQIWEATTGKRLALYRAQSASVWSVAWSPDGKLIALAGDDKTVQIWNAADGKRLFIYTGHSDFVYTVAWSPDGKRLASAGDDKTAQVWDAINGAHRYIYRGHTDSVRSVSWSPRGNHIASASWDKTVQVWVAE